MKTWTREDGRFYCYHLDRDLFGPVVVIRHGGSLRPGRTRTVPFCSWGELRRIVGKLVRRRRKRGYQPSTLKA